MILHNDPHVMPGTGESPAERLERAGPVAGTPGEAYLQRRRIPLAVAEVAGVRFDGDLAGRPALLVPLRDGAGEVTSLHGRILHVARAEGKMLTFGAGGGVIEVLGGLQAERPVLVEGLFDALSLAACSRRLSGCDVKRLLPPPRCKDWNTALVKRGAWAVTRWMRESLQEGGAKA